MKLGLGTVQFGCNYGISNTTGQVASSEIEKLLNLAIKNNIDVLDTASLYGNSEEVLGQFDLSKFKIVTKTSKFDESKTLQENIAILKETFANSLRKLRRTSVYALLFHETNDILRPDGDKLFETIVDLKNQGLVKKIGVSVYTPLHLERVLSKYDIDIVQLPLNILDQRFIPYLEKLKSKNIEIHTRSTFLQGLLLMKQEQINVFFDEIKPILEQLPNERLAYALQFVNGIKQVDKIIVGTTCLKDLEEIIDAIETPLPDIEFNKFSISEEKFIMPQLWKLK